MLDALAIRSRNCWAPSLAIFLQPYYVFLHLINTLLTYMLFRQFDNFSYVFIVEGAKMLLNKFSHMHMVQCPKSSVRDKN